MGMEAFSLPGRHAHKDVAGIGIWQAYIEIAVAGSWHAVISKVVSSWRGASVALQGQGGGTEDSMIILLKLMLGQRG